MTTTSVDALARVRVSHDSGLVRISTDRYTLLIDPAEVPELPYALLQDPAGRPWSTLSLLSSAHTLGLPDELVEVLGCTVEEDEDGAHVLVRTRSTAWDQHVLRLDCRAEALELSVLLHGRGRLTDLVLLGGTGTLPDGAAGTFASSVEVASLLVPAPGEPVQLVRPSHSAGQLGVVGDASPGRLHAVFSPPPFVFGLGRPSPTRPTTVPAGDWLGLGLRAPVSELTFTTFAYQPQDGGFLLRLAYEGHTEVDGWWASPVLVLRPTPSGWDVVSDHRRDLVEHGCAPAGGPVAASWWSQPLFCGWGAQCARVAPAGPTPPVGAPSSAVGVAATDPQAQRVERAVVGSAAGLCRQDVYDGWIDRLVAHDLDPGTVVLDDRWQAAYGTGEPDATHWPDLRGWIATQHAAGRRVLLWWKAWAPDGLPPQECVRDAAGRPVAADPANPRYRAHLAEIVARLLGPDGLDADGFKVDFTQRAPSGASLVASPGAWGVAALHLLLGTLHEAAHRAKPDALVVCHAVHPGFADVCDMVRLNDVAKADVHGAAVPVVDQLRMRHELARRTLPHHLVDTDQWPMPDRAEWRRYVAAQAELGVPALYYLETIDRSGETLTDSDLAAVAASWAGYRRRVAR